jgi:hypothetical protein
MPNPVNPVVALFRSLWPGGNGGSLSAQINIRFVDDARGERTRVSIDHRIPSDADDAGPGFRVTTKDQMLFSNHFHRSVRETVGRASLQRGRRLFFIDLARTEVIATLSYHLDDNAQLPLLITAIGQRIDGDANLIDRSRAAAALLKQYVHEIAKSVGRPSWVDYDNGDPKAEPELKRLGFRRAPKVEGRRPSGTMWRQDAPPEDA